MNPRPSKMHESLDFEFEDVLTAIADENMPSIKGSTARPFVKWAGGKRGILPELISRMPEKYSVYTEPFLGGAALFYGVRPETAYLSDINFTLVLTYTAVRDDVERLIRYLKVHESKHDKDYFLKMRKQLTKEIDPTKLGSILIYLNKTCYNGLYRVNQSGLFNVPMGSYTAPAILDESNLRAASKALQHAKIKQKPFFQVPVVKDNFYYLDPPYHNTFSSYDGSGFGDEDHKKLAGFCKKIDEAGGFFMLSNSDTPFIQQLYAGYNIESIDAPRSVSCKGTQRVKEKELIIRNYFGRKGVQDGEPTGEVR
jgi:DNA adenine methylase